MKCMNGFHILNSSSQFLQAKFSTKVIHFSFENFHLHWKEIWSKKFTVDTNHSKMLMSSNQNWLTRNLSKSISEQSTTWTQRIIQLLEQTLHLNWKSLSSISIWQITMMWEDVVVGQRYVLSVGNSWLLLFELWLEHWKKTLVSKISCGFSQEEEVSIAGSVTKKHSRWQMNNDQQSPNTWKFMLEMSSQEVLLHCLILYILLLKLQNTSLTLCSKTSWSKTKKYSKMTNTWKEYLIASKIIQLLKQSNALGQKQKISQTFQNG